MELIIEIPDAMYEDIKSGKDGYSNYVHTAIRNGTPIPKGHGKIIDADAFLEENKDYTGWILCSDAWGGENAYKDTLEDLINEAPTIIGAESEG